jgi:hypothetical protein
MAMDLYRIEYTVEVCSPFRIGAGTARPGEVDLEVLDPTSVSEDSVKGVLLEAARWVATLRGIPHCGAPQPEEARACGSCVLCRCFGAPGWPPASYEFRAWVLEGADRAHPDPEVDRASRLSSRHNRVDHRTGTVAREALWSAEWGRAGRFTGAIVERADRRPASDDEERREERELLRDALRFLDAVGARRRRGAGRCRLVGFTERVLHAPAVTPSAGPWRDLGDRWWATGVEAVLEVPGVFQQGATPAGLGGSLPWLPGSAVLGVAAARFAELRGLEPRKHGLGWELQGRADQFQRLFASGDVRWPFLFEEGAPISLSLRRCKNHPDDPEHFQDDRLRVEVQECRCGAPLAPVPAGGRRETVTRTAIDRRTRNAFEGKLFTVRQAPPGRRLSGVLRCKEDVKDLVDELLPPGAEVPCRLGADRSTKGAARLTRVPAPEVPLVAGEGDMLVIRLDTDAILPTSHLRYYRAFDPAWIAEAIGVSSSSVEVVKAFPATRRVASFSAARGLPGPTELALLAGSCALLRLRNQAPDEAALRAAAREGVGLRRREGYGQISFERVAGDG